MAPASLEVGLADEHYGNRDDLMRALADALAQEYRAIVEAGLLLQVRRLGAGLGPQPGVRPGSYRRYATRASRCSTTPSPGCPPTGSGHLCSWHGPHRNDVPLADIADIMLRVNAAPT